MCCMRHCHSRACGSIADPRTRCSAAQTVVTALLKPPRGLLCRCLSIPLILLCSTDDPVTRNTWQRLGFVFTTEEDLQRFGVGPRDLLHMDNTVQVRRLAQPHPNLRPL